MESYLWRSLFRHIFCGISHESICHLFVTYCEFALHVLFKIVGGSGENCHANKCGYRFVFIFTSFIGNCWIRNGRSLVYHAVVLTILKYRKNFIFYIRVVCIGKLGLLSHVCSCYLYVCVVEHFLCLAI